jgi:O-antigen biosynthesis protein
MAKPVSIRSRVTVDGKFFRLGKEKFYLKGVAYGPFAQNSQNEPFASPEQTARDFRLIRELGANVLRVYHVPPKWFLDLAEQSDLKLMVDVPWNKHLCFLDAESSRNEVREIIRTAAEACARHPAVLAISVVNEIPPDIVRWSGANEVADFIDELVEIVKSVDCTCLCTFGNFPPTEFLRPAELDFVCFNVYLHNWKPFENYMARLQMIADSKPLLLGEFGIDSLREGEEKKCEILSWKIETCFRSGLAGAMVYSFTDDWFKGGKQVENWAFGLTTADRQLKKSFSAVRQVFQVAPYYPLPRYPMVSVVVASYNGARTLGGCLDSLQSLNYPAYEVILVDDGSTDETATIAAQYSSVRYYRHASNLGLSVARNTGIDSARGEVVAFTDSDCRADKDWLYYLVGDLLKSEFAGIGGHNLLPPEDSWIAAAVMVSPGGPAHVMLTDRLAEHIPGCNMAFYKWALLDIGKFDPIFRKAGDDVDVCWRLQQRGCRLGFSPAGFVWHYRRSTVTDYLKQQQGYGEAEAMLVYRHPEYFNWSGASQWRGRIYSAAKFGVVTRAPMVYHGAFGSSFFQTLYTASPAFTLMLATSLEYHVLVTLPLLVLGAVFAPFWPLAITSFALSLAVCGAAAAQAELPKQKKSFRSRPLVALLFFLQPIVRGWARYQGRLGLRRPSLAGYENLDSLSVERKKKGFDQVWYWNSAGTGRIPFLARVLEQLDHKGWQNKSDSGWNNYDIEIYGSRWTFLQLTTATEELGEGKEVIRCRSKTKWTFLAHTIFWGLLGVQLVLTGFLESLFPWLGLMFLTLPAFIWWVAKDQRNLKRLIAVFLDEVADEMNWTKLNTERAEGNAKRAPALPERKDDTVEAAQPGQVKEPGIAKT